ncbi:flagellar protein FlgN [Myxococcota bacterium]|nr:flagellar protein FlgN [Myxococcota bacterium]
MSPPVNPINPVTPTQDVQPIGPITAIEGLVDLLRKERIAIAKLDRRELESIADGGAPLLDTLRSFITGEGPNGLGGEDRDRFTEAVKRLVAEAHVNALLLHDARSAVSSLLGQDQSAGTYNARGELSRAVRSIARKLV